MGQKKKNIVEGLSMEKITRRDFIRYSSIVLSAAAIPGISGCAGVQPKQTCLQHLVLGQNRNHKKVFESSMLGTVKLDNRIIRSATTLGLGNKDGRPTKELGNVYQELSDGGVGAIITGVVATQKDGLPGIPNALLLDRDEFIPDYKMLADAAHQNNTPVFMQVGHAGRQTRRSITGVKPVAPSAIQDKIYDEEVPKELTELEIKEIIQNFVLTIERAKKAGFDGVQIHAAHGYLLTQFLSSHSNHRTDKWGGSLENRFRITRKIFQEARKQVGDFPMLIKLSAYDSQSNGLRVEESIKIAKMLQDLGCDGVEISCGIAEDGFSIIRVPEIPTDAILKYNYKFKDKPGIVKAVVPLFAPLLVDKPEPIFNYNVCAAQEIKQNIDIPVIVVGGIRNLPDIEQIIGGSMADYVSMGRPFVIEPDIVNRFKAKSQTESECISCGYCLIAVDAIPVQCFYGEIT